MNAYMGMILKIDLSQGTFHIEALDEGLARSFLGGNGFAAKFIHDLVPPQTDPLDPANALVFATGPVNATPVWGGGRAHLAAISPQTGLFMDSNCGGNFGWMMKRSGYDAIIVTGRAAAPVYLLVTDETLAIKDASALWGLTTGATHARLLAQEGPGLESAVIGPAGENSVPYANVICSGQRISAAGRGGIGAVMGSKNLKALAVRGSRNARVARPEELDQYLRQRRPELRQKSRGLTEIGTPILLNKINAQGRLGTHNNSRETFEQAGAISGEEIARRYKHKNIACHGCPIACGKLVEVPAGDFAHQRVKMPEYETLYAIGAMLDNADLISIFNANAYCDEMGLDTISFGVTLAFLAECFEKGLAREGDLGRPLAFGHWPDLPAIVRATAQRQGLGALLAEGSQRLARRFQAEALLYCQQGLEMAGHSARGLSSMALGYATSTRGGSHHDTRPHYVDPPANEPGFAAQPEYCRHSQNNTAIGDSLVICRFVQERVLGTRLNEAYLPLLQALTGWDINLAELETIAERIYTLERLINVRRGAGRATARLPWRVMHEPIPAGPLAGRFCPPAELEQMLSSYYELRGWDENGCPSPQRLAELGLE